ncbi:hypothetical protein Fleli_0242 [Bernardetia litoralis DSM 6794]|uniref:Uncharacterized protein n=1 Tax=Bernardetia litoralis (strain ATCC 23117 / DSM 6794 / NBRC 15988 / NCIMB 1366 / Fx l1 / Sio-4) TaxID=880071 RepID=I4AFJ7_BERLS|nr:hypothetical protein [Bernardetia litoralis]AFM02732.1 hypothetical protein Fleli_0242 [Bernardetia litoralis DSM 6794]
MSREQTIKTAIANSKKSLDKLKKKLNDLIEKIYLPLDKEDIYNDKPIHNIEDKKYILENEFLNSKVPLRSIESRKKLIKIYQSMISDLTKNIILFESEINRKE